MTANAYINRIALAVPPHDLHRAFLHFAQSLICKDSGTLTLFQRMAARAGIEHRYSCLRLRQDLDSGPMLDDEGLYEAR